MRAIRIPVSKGKEFSLTAEKKVCAVIAILIKPKMCVVCILEFIPIQRVGRGSLEPKSLPLHTPPQWWLRIHQPRLLQQANSHFLFYFDINVFDVELLIWHWQIV
mmetsp:Transcript_13383/g.30006  ORF Transcript_13383/g.30006 Transcript_13383/m.30006 type:complete len:105 (-) Transcript_13383:3-317(-)